jgi:hypothetical protein
MKSKTLSLISSYYKILKEQDEQGAVDPMAAPPPPEEAPPAEPPAAPESLKMTQQGENEYIKSILELSKLYLDAVGNLEDKDQIDQIANAFDDALKSGQVNGREFYKQYQKIMNPHMPDEMRTLLGNIK